MTTGDATFEQLAKRYDAWYDKPVGAWADRYETEAVMRLLDIREGERVLDLGAGTGRHAAALARRGTEVIAVDASEEMLRVAEARTGGTSVRLVRADATALPFADGEFDAVLAVTSLCFTSDPMGALREAKRVLRPNGRLVLGELNARSLWGVLRRMKARIRPTTYRSAHFRRLDELRGMLADSGFEATRWEGVLYLPPINHAGFLRTLDPLERLCQRRCPRLGAFLAIEARSRD